MGNRSVYKWSLIERITVALLSFGGNVVLTRMLTTADFGLLAMIAIFTAVAYDISSCGMSDGLIHKSNPTGDDYSTTFVFNSAMGLVFGLSFFLGAPLVADFFRHQELTTIMRILGVCFFIQTMSFVQEARLRKELKMKRICIVRIAATLSAIALGIALAAMGMGYWALVSTQILLSVFMFLYFVAATRWFPKPAFSRKSFNELFGYGVHLMLAYMGTIIGKNINTFVLGRFYPSPSESGVYSQGAKLANVPFAVTETSLNSTFFVVASNEENCECRRAMIRRMYGVISGIDSALMFFILAVAAPAIVFLYGERWGASIPIFRILAVFELLACIKYFFQTVCKVYGHTSKVRNLTFVEIAVQLTLLAMFYNKGIIWIAWTQIGGVACTVAMYSAIYCRLIGLRRTDFIGDFVRPLLAPALACVAALLALYGLKQIIEVKAFWGCVSVVIVYGLVLVGICELVRPAYYLAICSKILKRPA